MTGFVSGVPLLNQLQRKGLSFDQLLYRALEISASKPDIKPEDEGFPDSYITLALYRLNTILTRVVNLDESRYVTIFHEYKLAPRCKPEEVVPSNRLCSVLNEAALHAAPGKTIGMGHFLKAIVSLTLDHEPTPAYGFEDQVIQNTFSAETLMWGLGYHAWTPISKAPEVKDLLAAIDGREPLEDFQYLMTLENERIIFRPTSVLGKYNMPSLGVTQVPRLALLTHLKYQYALATPSEILQLEDLINNPNMKESELQEFFETHPHFFRALGFDDIHPHVYLTREEEGPLIPDFILVDPALHKAMVLDLKLPMHKTYIRKPNRDRFSAAVDEARAQLLEYKDWFEHKANRQRMKEQLGMEIFRPRMGVFIGSNPEVLDAITRQKIASRYPDIEVATYDDILNYAQRRLMIVRGLNQRI